MKKWDRLQLVLYGMIGILGSYIIYKGGVILIRQEGIQKLLDSGKMQVVLEDAAVRTHFPGYAAVVEGKMSRPGMAIWMEPLVPVYSYMAAAGSAETEREASESTEAEPAAAGSIETECSEAEEQETEHVTEALPVSSAGISESVVDEIPDFDYLLNHYYTVDGGTCADAELLNAEELLTEDLSIIQNAEVPQILIYHTHSQEAFADSKEGNPAHTVVGMGGILAEELRDYGYCVIHDTGVYDLIDGILDRSAAYDYARTAVKQILEEYPTIEVIIDLHRDGVEGKKFVTEINGEPASMVMFFNGISRNSQNEPLYWLDNPYIQENLAFSLQLQMKAEEQYPGFTRNIYLKAERFNLHLRPRSLLIEAGTQLNTLEEERNAMEPLADLIHQVLKE